MKKLYLIIVTLLFVVGTTMNSCKSDYAQAIDYHLVVEGESDGKVDVKFPHGDFVSYGATNILLNVYSNDTVQVWRTSNAQVLDNALRAHDAKVQKAAQSVERALTQIHVKEAEGKYYIHIQGYAKEPVTGLVFKIDRTFTNE